MPPGDKGEITATFNIGDRTGTQVKTVTVETDEATNQKTVLTLKAEIPQQFEITPNFVFWKQGEKPDTKTINVKVGKDFTVKHIKVTSSTPDFQTKVEEAGKGEFKIDVKPQDTNKVVASMLTIQPEDSQKVFYATARITNAPLCSSRSSWSDCAGSSDCSDWSNALKFLLARQAACSGSLGASPRGWRGDLFPRQDFVALRHCAVGNGDCRAGTWMGRHCDLG